MSRPPDDEPPRMLQGRVGLLVAYLCFAVAAASIGAAIAILPLDRKVKLFLTLAALFLGSLVGFMAAAAHLVMRAAPKAPRDVPPKEPAPMN